jgi:hypothetical protein
MSLHASISVTLTPEQLNTLLDRDVTGDVAEDPGMDGLDLGAANHRRLDEAFHASALAGTGYSPMLSIRRTLHDLQDTASDEALEAARAAWVANFCEGPEPEWELVSVDDPGTYAVRLTSQLQSAAVRAGAPFAEFPQELARFIADQLGSTTDDPGLQLEVFDVG